MTKLIAKNHTIRKLELISEPRIALTLPLILAKVFLMLLATVLVSCTKTSDFPPAPLDSVSALESLAKAYEAESGNLPIAPTQMNAKAKKKFIIDVFHTANFSYQKTLQSFQQRDNKIISKNIKDLAGLLSLPHSNISSQSKAELYTEQELKAIVQIDIIAH